MFSCFTASGTVISPWPKAEFDLLVGGVLSGTPHGFKDDVRLLTQAYSAYRFAMPQKAKAVINWAVNVATKPSMLNMGAALIIHMARTSDPVEFDSRRVAFINDRLSVQNLPTLEPIF